MVNQILFWVSENSYGKTSKHWLKIDCPEKVKDLTDADNHLETIIKSLMDENDWGQVNDFKPTKIGKNPLTPGEQKTIRDEKKRLKSILDAEKTKLEKQAELDRISGFRDNKDINFYGSNVIDFSGGDLILNKINELLKDKSILFLENSNTLTDQVGTFYQVIKHLNIKTNLLFNLKNLTPEYIAKKIIDHDVIIFQSTFTTENSRQLETFLLDLKMPKIIIECKLGEPRYFWKPKNVVHDIYIMDCFQPDKIQDWSLKLLETDKPYWQL